MGVSTAYACNGPSVDAAGSQPAHEGNPSAGPGDAVPYTVFNVDDGTEFAIAVGGEVVVPEAFASGPEHKGTFEMPDFGSESRNVHMTLYVGRHHEDAEPAVTGPTIWYRAPQPAPPAEPEAGTRESEPSASEGEQPMSVEGPRTDPGAAAGTPAPPVADTRIPSTRVSPNPVEQRQPARPARRPAATSAPAPPHERARRETVAAPAATELPVAATIPVPVGSARSPRASRGASTGVAAFPRGLRVRPPAYSPGERSAQPIAPAEPSAAAVLGLIAALAAVVAALLWWWTRRGAQTSPAPTPESPTPPLDPIEEELQRILAEEHVRATLESERGPPVGAPR